MPMTRVLAGVFVSLCLACAAQAGDGIYLSLESGAGVVGDWEHTRTKSTWCGPEAQDALASFDAGFAVFGAAGYSLDRWRLELEGGYRSNDVDSYVKESWSRRLMIEKSDVAGELSEASLMLNIVYDVPVFERISFSVGLGAGADYSRLKLATHWTPVDEEDWHFAYQGLAGVNYAISETTVVFVAYRFTTVSDTAFDANEYVHFEGEDFEKQAATAGVRFTFNAPAALVPVPPATPIAEPLQREFMIFFAFNQSTLSPQARATIAQAVIAVRESGSAAIRVVGHADRVGSVGYNKALSLRRAKSARAALIAEGIAKDTITISGRGESEPMVQTADGVAESQNRRVHISF